MAADRDRAFPDRPGVIAPPPLIFAAFFAAGWLIDHLSRASLFEPVIWNWVGGAVAAGGIVLGFWVIALFRRARTAIEPWKPTTSIVTSGPFRISRNPTYLALALVYAGMALLFDLPWALALLLPALATIDVGVVRREERYLARKFGDGYQAYRRKVRRWL